MYVQSSLWAAYVSMPSMPVAIDVVEARLVKMK